MSLKVTRKHLQCVLDNELFFSYQESTSIKAQNKPSYQRFLLVWSINRSEAKTDRIKTPNDEMKSKSLAYLRKVI